jgi:hypothetical protein
MTLILFEDKNLKYIAEGLRNLNECPYCGTLRRTPSGLRPVRLELIFILVYLEYHQKTRMLKRLHSKAEKLST